MGLAFCLLFTWWFVTGIFMLCCDFPSVSAADRLEHERSLRAEQTILPAPDAWERLNLTGSPRAARLSTFDSRPAWFFYFERGQSVVYADTGEIQNRFPPELNLRTAAAWAGQPGHGATMDRIPDADQWTVPSSVRAMRPFMKFSWPDGQQVYISESSGEVVQYTTRRSRFLAWLGPIPHWLYFAPLRRNVELWRGIVIWLSGIATVTALLGLTVGIWISASAGRNPWQGAKRLHTTLGMYFGVIACTWSFSGMMSMDPFPVAAEPILSLRAPQIQLSAFRDKSPAAALAQVSASLEVRELELIFFDAQPFYIATGNRGRTKIIPVHGDPVDEFKATRIMQSIEGAVSSRRITAYDTWYRDRDGRLPLPVILVRLNDKESTRYYIDPATAKVAGASSNRSWMERWLYHGLHSLDLPWLYLHRPAWDAVVLTLLLGGTALSVTSLIMGFRVLRRRLVHHPLTNVPGR
jgi:hypothetical protein